VVTRFDVRVDGTIAADPQALNAVRLWFLRAYKADVSRNGGAGNSAVLMEFIAALGESVRIREVLGETVPLAVPDTEGTGIMEVSVAEASRLMGGCSAGYVRRLLREGKLAGRRQGRDWLVNATDIDRHRPRRAA
jgi:excisionase family DNA binding protein